MSNLPANYPANDGHPFQIEPVTYPATWQEPELVQWVVVYQNYSDPNRREAVYQADTLKEAMMWVQPYLAEPSDSACDMHDELRWSR